MDDRQEDVTTDPPSANNAGNRTTEKDASTAAKRYTDAALPDQQARICEFIPIRRWTLAVLLMSACSVAAGLVGLHGQLASWARFVGRANLAAFDLAAPASMATWYSSLLLALAALVSLFVFAIERHRADDYRGRYRFWLWTAAALLFASIDATASLRGLAGALLAQSSRSLVEADGAVWALLLAGLIWAPLAIRGAFELRHCRGAAVALATATIGYALHLAVRFALIFDPATTLAAMAQATALMASHVGLLFSLTLFARHVMLDAQGKLPVRRARPKRRLKKTDENDEKAPSKKASAGADKRRATTRIDEAHETTTPQRSDLGTPHEKSNSATGSTKSNKSPKSTSHVEAVDDDFEDDDSPRKLSKAERRRLRKQQRRAKK